MEKIRGTKKLAKVAKMNCFSVMMPSFKKIRYRHHNASRAWVKGVGWYYAERAAGDLAFKQKRAAAAHSGPAVQAERIARPDRVRSKPRR
jgi:hypothetical protein